MASREELIQTYSKMETVDLLVINANKKDYTELANLVVSEELKKREVSQGEIEESVPILKIQNSSEVLKNFKIDLNFFQKTLFYFIFLPRFRNHLILAFIQEGYILKILQSNYYGVVGFSAMIVSVLMFKIVEVPFVFVWMFLFLPAYLFDIFYNKNRQINDLDVKVQNGEVLDSF